MAYEGGYPAQQRPYAGQAAPRQNPAPAPMQGPGQYQQQGYEDYQGGQGYDYYDDGSGGYGPDYGQQYQDPSYGQGPPDQRYPPQRQDYYGAPPPNGAPMGGRGGPGPLPRSQTMGNMRNGPYPPRGGGLPSGPGRVHPNGPPRGGGPPGAYGRGPPPPMDMPPQGRPPMNGGMRSPVNGRFGGNQFPNQPQYDESQLSNQMGAMDISQRPRMPVDRHSDGAQRGGMRPPEGIQSPTDGMRGLPPPGLPRGFDEGRRGSEPAPGPGFGPAGQGQGYAEPGFGPGPGPLGPPGNDFGPPSRSMTMPMNDPAQRREPMPPQPPMPYGPVPGRGLPPPQRPATSQSQRPPPQRIYPNQGPPPQPGYGGGPGYGNGPQPPGPRQASRASYDDIFDSYGGGPAGNGDYPPGPPNDMGYYNGPPRQASLGGSMDPYAGPGGAPNGPLPPGPVPQALNIPRTKSQPNLRNGQPVFEMSGDIPPMPNMPGQPGGGPGQPGGRPGPVGLPANPAGPRGGPGSLPPNPSPSQSANPDALPSHPTPVRPGLMADSVVNVANKPPPVRTYGTSSPAPTMNSGPPSTATPSEPPPDPVTSEELERLRVIVKADPNDQETGLRFAKRLVEAADVLVPNVADPKTRARSRDRYLADAYKVLKKLANAQNKEAMFFFADCIGRSLFSNDPDHKEAFTLYQSAAKLGHAAAAYRTAVCCEIGHEDGGGTRKDPLKAIQWYKRAATLGDTPAMYKMGMIQLKGLLGQPKNPREAIGWLKRAADQSTGENPHALHELGLLYESAQPNDVIIRDEKYAFTLFKKAAELGYKFSQFRLGCAYEYGLMGCPIDPRLSIMWYSKAAMQEEHQAELALSGWYLTGSEGVLAQSDTEAYLWARKAAMAGLAKAEYAMGYFTEDGIGVPANMEDAKRWYWRAAAQDFPKARERLEDLKRSGKNGPRQRERISRSKMNKQQEGECSVM